MRSWCALRIQLLNSSRLDLPCGPWTLRGVRSRLTSSQTGKLGLQDGKRTTAEGSAFKTESLTSSPGAAANLPARSGGNIPTIRIAGKWSDAAHPGCTRKIQLSAKQAFIAGADEDGKPVRCIAWHPRPSPTFPCRVGYFEWNIDGRLMWRRSH